MSIESIKIKIADITDGGRNTAAEMRGLLTDITDTFSGGTGNTVSLTSDLTNDGADGINPFITGVELSAATSGTTGGTGESITGATFDTGTGDLDLNSTGSTITVNLDDRYSLTGHTHSEYALDSEFTSHTGDTNIHYTKASINLSDLGSTGHTHSEYALDITLDSHTGDTNIHYTKASINLSELGTTGHTHTEADITDLQDYSLTGHTHSEYALDTTLDSHTGDTTIHFTKGSINLSELGTTGHTHSEYALDSALNSHTGDTSVHYTKASINLSELGTTGHTHSEYALDTTLDSHTGDTTIHFEMSAITITESQIDDLQDYSLTGHTHTVSEITDFTDNSSNWDVAYDDSITGMSITGTIVKTITLEQRDGSTITANFNDSTGGGGTGESITGATFDTGTGDLDLTTNSGSTITVNLDGRYSLTGHTHSEYVLDSEFTSHTGDTSIHFTKGSINLDDLGSSAHTHTVSDITDFPTNVSTFTNDIGYITGFTDTNDNIYLTGSTFNTSDGVLTFTNISGGTFNVDLDGRYLTGFTATVNTDDYVSSAGFNITNGVLTLTRISGGTVTVDLDDRYSLTGHTHSEFTSHTGDTSIHFTKGSINLSDLGTTGHTHITSEITDFPTNVSSFTNDTGYITGFTNDNTFVSGATFNISGGTLEFTNTTGGTFNTNLDDRYFKIDGSDTVTGNMTVSTDGSSFASPRIIGYTGLSTGEGMAFDFGDAFNSIVSGFDRGVGMYSYNTMYFYGGRTSLARLNINTAINQDAGRAVVFRNSVSNKAALVIRAAASQTNNILQIENSSSTTLSGVDNDGKFFGDGSLLSGITTVTGSTFDTGTGILEFTNTTGGTFNTNLDNRYSLTGHTHSEYALDSEFTSHTGDTTIHFTEGSISITESQISDLGTYQVTSEKGNVNGYAELDGSGFVPASQLPSYVNDVLEFANLASFPLTGETGIVYIAIDTGFTYRWSGSVYAPIGNDLALGETSATAYRGDRGKIAYDHSLSVSGNPHNVTKTDLSLENVDNTSDVNKPVSTSQQTALDLKASQVDLVTHTGDTTIHFTKGSINLSDLGSSAHTHTISEITDFPTNVSSFTNDAGYLTGATGGIDTFVSGTTFDTGTGILEFTNTTGGTFNTSLDNRYSLTGHTHSEYSLDSEFTSHTGDTTIHFTKSSINLSDLGSTGHTHITSDITDFPTNVSSFTNDANYISGITNDNTLILTGDSITGITTQRLNIINSADTSEQASIYVGVDEINGTTEATYILPQSSSKRIFLGTVDRLAFSLNLKNVLNIESMPIFTTSGLKIGGGSQDGSHQIYRGGFDLNNNVSGGGDWTINGDTSGGFLPTTRLVTISSQTGEAIFTSGLTANTVSITSGASNEFLKADGSVDSNSYSLTGHTHSEYALDTTLDSHTGDTSIHFTKGSINLSELGSTGHTHSEYGNVTKVGTPLNNQVGIWTGDGTIEGGNNFTFGFAGNLALAASTNITSLLINTTALGAEPAFKVFHPDNTKAFQFAKTGDANSWASFEISGGNPTLAMGAGGASSRDVSIARTNGNEITIGANVIVTLDITADNFIRTSGATNEFLKADGSVDSNSYSLTGHTHDFSGLTNTGHTHTISEITDYPTALVDSLVATGGEAQWVLSSTPSDSYPEQLYNNGAFLVKGTDWGRSGDTITFSGDATPLSGEVLSYFGNTIPASSPLLKQDFILALSASDGTPLSGASTVSFRVPNTFVCTDVRLEGHSADTTTNVTVDVLNSGTSIFDTSVSIDATEETSVTTTTPFAFVGSAPSITINDNNKITFSISNVTDITGLKIQLIGHRG